MGDAESGRRNRNNRFDDSYDSFEDRRIRHAFVRKVLSIVGAQLFLTFLIVLLFVTVYEIKAFVLARKNSYILWVCMGVSLVVLLVLQCIKSVRRKSPINLILLFIFTICESYIIGAYSSTKYSNEVLLAFGATVVLCVSLILFACQTKCDFTGFAPFLFILTIILLIMGIISIFWHDRIFRIIICSVGILIFSAYLIVDIQMMLGGKHKYQYDPEDYITAAVSIYIDIIQMFMYILELIGLISDD